MELFSPPYLAWGWRIALYRSSSMPGLLIFLPLLKSDRSDWQHRKPLCFFSFLFSVFTLINFFALRKCFSDFGWKSWFFASCGCTTMDWEEGSSWTCKFLSFLLKIPTLPALRCNWNYALRGAEICICMGIASPSVYYVWACVQNTQAYSVDCYFQKLTSVC